MLYLCQCQLSVKSMGIESPLATGTPPRRFRRPRSTLLQTTGLFHFVSNFGIVVLLHLTLPLLFLSLTAHSVFGEDALVNVSVEKKEDNDGKLAGYIRIRSKTQGIALSLGDRITSVQRGLQLNKKQ